MNAETRIHMGSMLSAAQRYRIALVSASWHGDIVECARDAAARELQSSGVASDRIDSFTVPGVYEIPLFAKRLTRCRRYNAIVAFGFVVNGGIYHHEYVTSAVIDGLMHVQIESEVPIFSCVLTPWNFHEHADHVEFFKKHMGKKGVEVTHALLAALAAHHDLTSVVGG